MPAIALLSLAWGLGLGRAGGQRAPSGPAVKRYPGVEGCIDQYVDDNGSINLKNHCGYSVTLRVYFGSNQYDSLWTLGSGQGFSSGYTNDDVEHQGPIQWYACPSDHPEVRDLNGERLYVPGKPYLCE